MRRLRRLALALSALLAVSPAARAGDPASWPERDAARVYVFGNSLIHHLTDSDLTTVPHWLAAMARHAGKDFAADGRWGFPRQFAAELPPDANWRFREVARAWEPGQQAFRAAGFDTVILNPENYIQYDPADRPYAGDNPDRATPLQATLAVLDWVAGNADAPRVLIYEGWADLHPFARSFPPSARDMARYHRHAAGDYHRWYVDYVAKLRAARPDRDIALLPVGQVMSEIMAGPLMSDIPAEALYSDLSPHGTATTYLLAAMIAYPALYGSAPPAGLPLPEEIDPRFAERYDRIAAEIGVRMGVAAPASGG